jgi:hypothetical protein
MSFWNIFSGALDDFVDLCFRIFVWDACVSCIYIHIYLFCGDCFHGFPMFFLSLDDYDYVF